MTEGSPIVIKTDVSWCGASFIIDDTEFSFANPETYPACDIFRVENDYPIIELDAENPYIKAANEASPAIEKNGKTKKLDLGLGYPALLVVYNDENTQYIRNGFKDNGTLMAASTGQNTWGGTYKEACYFVCNFIYKVSPVLTTGIEYLWGSRKDLNDEMRHNNRLQASLRVNF